VEHWDDGGSYVTNGFVSSLFGNGVVVVDDVVVVGVVVGVVIVVVVVGGMNGGTSVDSIGGVIEGMSVSH